MKGFLINLSIQVWRADRQVCSVYHQQEVGRAQQEIAALVDYGTLGGRVVPAFGLLATPGPPGGSGQCFRPRIETSDPDS